MSSEFPNTDKLFENNKAKGTDKIDPPTEAEREYLYDVLDWVIVSTAASRGHKTMHVPVDLHDDDRSNVDTQCVEMGVDATKKHRRKPMNAWPLGNGWVNYCRQCVKRWRNDELSLDYPEELDQ